MYFVFIFHCTVYECILFVFARCIKRCISFFVCFFLTRFSKPKFDYAYACSHGYRIELRTRARGNEPTPDTSEKDGYCVRVCLCVKNGKMTCVWCAMGYIKSFSFFYILLCFLFLLLLILFKDKNCECKTPDQTQRIKY